MNDSGILHAITSLNSNKIKDRNAALDELTATLKNSSESIPSSALGAGIQSLIELLDLERGKYVDLLAEGVDQSSGKFTLCENRLSSVAYVLRLLIEKTCSRFKLKTLKLLLSALPELMVAKPNTLLEPVSVHLTFSLLALVKDELFQSKFTLQQWMSLVDTLCVYLMERFNVSLTDKNVSNLLFILNTLMKIDTVGLYQISRTVHHTVLKFLRLSRRQTINTRPVICLVNLLLLKTHCSNILMTRILIKETWKHILDIDAIHTDSIQKELCFFDIYASELIGGHLPTMVGHEEAETDRFEASAALICRDYISSRLSTCKAAHLTLDQLNFCHKGAKKNDWFEFHHIQLKKFVAPFPWLRLFGITKLLSSYFEMLQANQEEENIFKRRKLGPDLACILKDTYNIVDFLLVALASTSSSTQAIVLQLIAFYASLNDIEATGIARLKDLLLQQFEHAELTGYVCLAFIPLLSQNMVSFTDDDLNRLLKLCIPLLKRTDFCRVVCALLSNGIKHTPGYAIDDTTLNQIYDLYELSDLNGPALLCNESFMFWQYFQNYGKELNFRAGKTSFHQIIIWLNSKWSQILGITQEQDYFHSFIGWLANRCGLEEDNEKSLIFDQHIDMYPYGSEYSYWTGKLTQRHFLLQSSKPIKKIREDGTRGIVLHTADDKLSLNDILYRLLALIEPDTSLPSLLKFKWIIQAVKLIGQLAGSSAYLDCVIDFKRSIENALHTLKFEEKESFEEFFQLILSLNISSLNHLVLHELDISRLLTDYRTLLLREKQKLTTASSGFDQAFDKSTLDAESTQIDDTSDSRNSFEIGLMIKACLHMALQDRDQYSSRVLNDVLDLLHGIEPRNALNAINVITSWMDENVHSWDQSTLENCIQLLNDHILQTNYNTSDIGMCVLCAFLDATRNCWLENSDNSVGADSNDILDWVISRFEDNSFSGVEAIIRLTRLLLNMLSNHDLSRCAKNGKQRVFLAFTKCLGKLDKSDLINILPQISTYMSSLSHKNQDIIFSEILMLLDVPQQGLEASAFYSLGMFELSLPSYPNLIAALKDSMRFTQFEHTRFYILRFLRSILSHLKMNDLRELFHFCRFDLLKSWLERECDEPTFSQNVWDLDLFGFTDLETFIKLYARELTAIYFSSQKVAPNLLDKVKFSTKQTESKLFRNSFHLTVPLSFCSGGIGGECFNIAASSQARSLANPSPILAVKWVLNFLDLGSLHEMASVLLNCSSASSPIGSMFEIKNSSSRYQFPLHIPLHKGAHILKNSFFGPPLSHREVDYLLSWILSDMEDAVYPLERVKCLRQIKFLLASYHTILNQCCILPRLLSTLSQFVMETTLHDETMGIIQCILQNRYIDDSHMVKILPSLYSAVFIFLRTHPHLSDLTFVGLSDQITTWNLPYSKTWISCNEIIHNRPITSEVYDNDELIDEPFHDSSKLLLMSLIFSHAERFRSHFLNKVPTEFSVSNILKSEIPDCFQSRNFQLWSASSLSSFDISNNTKNTIEKPKSLFCYNYAHLFANFGSLEYFFENFLCFCGNTKALLSPTTSFLCMSLTNFIITEYPKCDKIREFPASYYEKEKSNRVEISEDLFVKIHPLSEVLPGIDEFFAKCYLDRGISYDEWLSEFVIGLISHISLYVSQLSFFVPLIRVCSALAETSLPILFNLAIYYEHKKAMGWINALFSNIWEISGCKESKKKFGSLLEIIGMLRSGHRLSEKFCESAYNAIPLEDVYKTALTCDQISFAYMIFEEITMSNSFPINYKILGTIYESIGDPDLLSGLSTSHDIAGSLEYINKTEPKSWKAFLFNNAEFDAQFNSQSYADKSSLLKSSENLAFYGLTTTLAKEERAPETNEFYGWALQLGMWNLPVPERIDAKEKGIYATLKKVMVDSVSPARILEDSMADVFSLRKNFPSTQEWLDLLSELSLLGELARALLSPEDTEAFIKKTYANDRERLKSVEFADYKGNLQARYLLLELIANKDIKNTSFGPSEFWTIAGIHLANSVKLAIENKSPQDALKNASLLDKMVKAHSSANSRSFGPAILEKLQKSVTARALWESKEFKTPIMMMRDLLNRTEQSIDQNSENFLASLIDVPRDEVQSLLVKWTSESRIETASAIFEKYISNLTVTIKNHESRALIFYTLGDFLNMQLRRMTESGEIEERQKRCDKGILESQALEVIYKNTKLPEIERKDAKRHLNKVRAQLCSDMRILDSITTQRMKFVWKSLYFYLNTLIFTSSDDDDVLDKFCGLWFEYDADDLINVRLKKEIGAVPSWKFLPWVNQIASKLSTDNTEFQKALQLTMKRLLYKLPYDSLYSVLSIKQYGKYSNKFASSINQKIKAVERIIRDLQGYEKGEYYNQFVMPLEEFCHMCVDFATMKIPSEAKNSKRIQLSTIKNANYWQDRIATQKIPLPTMHVNINSSSDGKIPRPYIVSVETNAEISSTGLSLPKIMTFRISDGSTRKVLMKGSNDDLRQDAIMEQVFKQVNKILQKDKEMRKLDLDIATYEVIPLGPRAGIIEYVPNSISLHEILNKFHKHDSISFNEARNEMRKVQNKSNAERLAVYEKICGGTAPQLRNFFFDSFFDPSKWLEAKNAYTKGTAVNSIVGYVLGLGDRHLNNILIDFNSGKPIHIDLGIAFDQGRLLPIPELVPFRLTRDIVDGFGVTGVDGLFRKSCERTYAVLQKNYGKVMHVLNILKWDPLYSWVMSPVKKHKHLLEEDTQLYDGIDPGLEETANVAVTSEEENQESYRALKGVEEKLNSSGLSVEATVQELIQQASDPRNLSVIYMGWSPFY